MEIEDQGTGSNTKLNIMYKQKRNTGKHQNCSLFHTIYQNIILPKECETYTLLLIWLNMDKHMELQGKVRQAAVYLLLNVLLKSQAAKVKIKSLTIRYLEQASKNCNQLTCKKFDNYY